MSSRLSLILVSVFGTGAACGYMVAKSTPSADRSMKAGEIAAIANHSAPPLAVAHSLSATRSGPEAAKVNDSDGDVASAILTAAREPSFYKRGNELYQIVSRLDAEGVANAMKLAESFSPADRELAQPILLSRWLDLDAETAFQWVSGLPDSKHRTSLLEEGFASLGAKDPATAVHLLEELRGTAYGSLTGCRHYLFRAWARRDPVAAVQQALVMKNNQDRSSALFACVSTWAKREPLAALAWVKQMPSGENKESAHRALFRGWSEDNPVAAANALLTLENGKERDSALAVVIEGASKNDPKFTRELIAQLPEGHTRNSAISSIVSSLAYHNPREASEFFNLLPPAQQLHSGFSIAPYYARQDPAAALEWATQLGTERLRNQMRAQVVQHWADEDPIAAIEYATKNLPEDSGLLSNLLANWARRDPHAAITRAEAISDQKARERALSQCIGPLAVTNPAKAQEILKNLAGPARESGVSNLALHWGQKDPAAAATWLFQSDDANMFAPISGVMTSWARESPVQAAEWLQRLPAGQKRDQAVSSFVMSAKESDPEGAAAWAMTLQDQQQRENSIRNIASEWLQHDKKAAMNWLRQASGISEQTRRNLLQQNGSR